MYKKIKIKKVKIKMNFFVPMKKIPRTTHQQKQVHVVRGKPIFYESQNLKQARQIFMDNLAKFVPEEKMTGKLRLMVKWCFPADGKHSNGTYKDTKPDLDNSMKLLQDCMTDLGFWEDDRYIVSLIVEKFWADIPGIYIEIEVVEDESSVG